MLVHLLNLGLIGLYDFANSLRKTARSPHKLDQSSRWISRIVAFQLIVVLALRHPSVGVDVGRYVLHFGEGGARGVYGQRYEPGYQLLVAIIRALTSEPQVFIALIALCSIVPVAIFIERESPDPLLSWFLYVVLQFYAFTFSGFRQSIAFGLTMVAFSYVRRRRPVPFVLLVLLATSFHASAVLFLPAYFVFRVRLRWPTAVLAVCVGAVVFAFRAQVFGLFTSLFYETYEVEESSSYTWMTMCAALLAVGYIRFGRVRAMSSGREGYFSVATFGVATMLFASVGTNVMRVADYFFVAILIVLPLALSTCEPQIRTVIRHFGVPALFVVFALLTSGAPFGIMPYRFFWQSL